MAELLFGKLSDLGSVPPPPSAAIPMDIRDVKGVRFGPAAVDFCRIVFTDAQRDGQSLQTVAQAGEIGDVDVHASPVPSLDCRTRPRP